MKGTPPGPDARHDFCLLPAWNTPYDILAAHRASTPIAAVRCGRFSEKKLEKAEWIFDDVPEIVERIDQIDEYFRR